jgi:hypothetical protein
VDRLESILFLIFRGGGAEYGYPGRPRSPDGESNPGPATIAGRRFLIDVSHDLQDQQARAAKNQALFREINERIEKLNADFSAITPDPGDWVCECANESCLGLVQMSLAEYEAVRAAPNRFFIMPDDDHLLPQVERVVERTERYWIVEKIGVGAVVAKQADPRSPG